MKRIVNNLAPALGAGALLALGATAQAQTTNNLSLNTPSSLNVDANSGSFVVKEILDPANGAKVTAAQMFLVYDPTVWQTPVGDFTSNTDGGAGNNAVWDFSVGPANGKKTSFVAGGTTYTAWGFVGVRFGDNTDGPLPANTLAGTVTLKPISGSNAKFGESDVFLSFNGTGSLLAGAAPKPDTSQVTSSPGAATGFGTFVLKPTITPGPSSLLVFAMGGAAPILGMLRRRRSRA